MKKGKGPWNLHYPGASSSSDAFEDRLGDIEAKNLQEYLDKRSDRAQIDHKLNVYSLREKFAWFALLIVIVWLGALMLGFLFHATQHFMPRLLHALAMSVSVVIVTDVPFYCYIASDAQRILNLAEKYAAMAQNMCEQREWRARAVEARAECKRLTYYPIAVAAIVGPLVFWLSLKYSRNASLFPSRDWHLSDSMLTVAATSTTVSILGILGAVMFWLFPRDKASKPKDIDKSTQDK